MRWNSVGERCWNEYEPDCRHAELIVKSLNLENAKGVTTPSVKKRLEEVLAMFPQQLDALQTRGYRSVLKVAAYLSQDGPDLSFSAKEPGQRHAETDRTIDDQSEAPWTVFVETSTTCSTVPRTHIHGKRWACMVAVTMLCASYHTKARRAWCLRASSHTQSAISLSSCESEKIELSNAQPLA